MKKYIFALLFVCTSLLSFCQSSFFPREPHFHYSWWYENYLSDSSNYMGAWMAGGITIVGDSSMLICPAPQETHLTTEIAHPCYTDSALTIYGVSVPLDLIHCRPTKNEYVRLYQLTGDSMVLIDEIQQDIHRPMDPETYRLIPRDRRVSRPLYRPQGDTCINAHPADNYVSREYYFNTPHTVTDTFYISVTTHSLYYYPGYMLGDYYYWPDPNALYYDGLGNGWDTPISWNDTLCKDKLWQFPSFPYKAMWIDRVTGEITGWHDTSWCVYMCLFPIVNYNSPLISCDTADKLQLNSQIENNFVFSWQASGHQPTHWQFCYAPVGTSPDDGIIIDCSSPTISITIDSNVQYMAYVRGYCEFGGRYSDWSTGLSFSYGTSDDDDDDDDDEGITTSQNNLTTITPNPAKDKLQIASMYELLKVEIFDIDSRKVKHASLSGHDTSIDISRLKSGIYFVKIHTSAGTTTKKLIVE